MAEMRVRDRVKAIQVELRPGDVVPSRAREMLMELTSLYGNCLAEVTTTKVAFNGTLLECLDAEKKANRARIRAEMTQEFRAWEEARNAELLAMELIRSLKAILKSTEEEMRMAGRS